MITAFLLVQFFVDPAKEPLFEVPRQYACSGINFSDQDVKVMVTIDGTRDGSSFVLDFETEASWPKGRATISDSRATYFESEQGKLWYWIEAPYRQKVIDGEVVGFGFDVSLDHSKSSIRFQRANAMKNGTDEIGYDPLGAKRIDCIAVSTEAQEGKTQ